MILGIIFDVHQTTTWKILQEKISKNEIDRNDAQKAIQNLDYSVIPFKYRLLYKWPYFMAKLLNKLDKLYHRQ